jgi:protein-disulfide isomerase
MISRILRAAALAAALSIPAYAAPTTAAALKSYAARALTQCADAKIELEPIQELGPAGFQSFKLTQTSSDDACGRRAYLLYSPSSAQVIIGNVFGLPLDNRSVEARVAEATSQILKQNLSVSVAPFPLPDGLRAVSMTKQTKWGPFAYRGYVDSTQRFLVVGARGNLYTDPGTTLLDSLDLKSAVHRGNAKSKVHIIELSDFECPTCGRAHKEIEPLIAKNLNKVRYARMDLPLFEHHEWAIPAALGARAIQKVAPAKYWKYVDFVFANQEDIGKSPSFDKILQNFCEDHDIDWKRVEKIYRSPTERAAILEQVSRAFDVGISSTPTYIVNGQILGYGPEGKTTIAAIKKALGLR